MENWHPSVTFEVGYAAHRERVARAEAARRQPAHTGTPRAILAAALLALARRIAPPATAPAPAA
jgi:hypothetical protein